MIVENVNFEGDINKHGKIPLITFESYFHFLLVLTKNIFKSQCWEYNGLWN